jgi:hypothetical protein
MQIAASQRPNPIDADDERETRWTDADISTHPNNSDVALAASAFAQSHVSAETSQHVLDWGQRQADALTLLAETMLARGACSRHGADRQLLHVHVDISTLCAPNGEGRSAIEDGPAIPPETLRRLGCDAATVTWIEDAAGKTLDVGRKTRVLSAGLRRALEQRDIRCRFPACEQRGFLDAHHIEHWADGGDTKLVNLIAICKQHHRALHEGGFRIEGDADAPRFIRPDGKLIDSVPCARQSSTPRGLAAQNARIGLEIHARTAITGWGGERADYTCISRAACTGIRAAQDRQVNNSPPPPAIIVPGMTRRRHGSSTSTANAADVGPSRQGGMIAGSYPTGAGAVLNSFQTRTRVSSSNAQRARHSAKQVSWLGAQ